LGVEAPGEKKIYYHKSASKESNRVQGSEQVEETEYTNKQ